MHFVDRSLKHVVLVYSPNAALYYIAPTRGRR